MDFVVVIPARYGSTRLPRKPLLDLAGKPLIQHVYERGVSSAAREVVIATDDERIRDVAQSFGAKVCMTSPTHESGTDRIAEVVAMQGYEPEQIIVNLQGDEPLMPLSLLYQVAQNLHHHPQASIATLCEPISSVAELFNSNIVKVVFDEQGYAMYFSRAPIPWERDADMKWDQKGILAGEAHFRHIGLYAYRASFLTAYTSLANCKLEGLEALEQLRAMWHGYKIHVDKAVEPSMAGIDTQEDLMNARAVLSGGCVSGA